MISNKKIFISGGGTAEDSFLLDKKFVSALRRRKVLYIPIALNRDTIGFESCYDWIISSLSPHSKEFVDITMLLDLQSQSLEISDFDGIYIGGGNVYRLLKYFLDAGFDKTLKIFLKNGGIIYGGSAGAIILGQSIETVSEENTENYKYNKGLSLIKDYSIKCHYRIADDNRIEKFIESHQCQVIALSEGAGLIIGEDGAEVVGYGDVLIFDLNGEKNNVKADKFLNYICLNN